MLLCMYGDIVFENIFIDLNYNHNFPNTTNIVYFMKILVNCVLFPEMVKLHQHFGCHFYTDS